MTRREVKVARKLIQRPIRDNARDHFFYWLEGAGEVRRNGFLYKAERDDYCACIYWMRQNKIRGIARIP